MPIKSVDAANFDAEISAAPGPVVIDFWAEWCGPCKSLGVTLGEVASENDAVTILTVDIDSNPDLASRFGVRSVPTMALIRGGEHVDTLVGNQPKSKITGWVGDA